MCNCNDTCPKCDPGIEAFYQEKLAGAKKAAEHMATQGIIVGDPTDLLDAKDIWYEYCELKRQEQLEAAEDRLFDLVERDYSPEDFADLLKNPNEWK